MMVNHRKPFHLFLPLLVAVLLFSGCSAAPGAPAEGGGPGGPGIEEPGAGDPGIQRPDVVDPAPEPAKPGKNPETCLAVSSAVLTGSALPAMRKLGLGGDSLGSMKDTLKENLARVPAELQPSLESMMQALEEAGGNIENLDVKAFTKSLDTVRSWLQGNCTGK